ncbi:MAG: hypothetical protein ACRD2W_19755 [Acidimicrobiales bacterium]
MARDDSLAGIGAEGPVLLEVFVLCVRTGTIELTGPCGPAPWYIEKAADEHPVDVVYRLAANAMGEPDLVHSTSWRQADEGVVLSFFVVVEPALAEILESRPVIRDELARSGATAAPAVIASGQVLEHAIRHLAWLALDDEIVHARLSEEWLTALAAYRPEPFRNLG